MKDKARNYHLGSGLKMPALHGHTTIELHNHRTSFRERIEHDNTFTDGITNYLLSSGWFDNSPFRNDAWRGQALYRSLLGGILLFDSEIEDNNGVYPTIMPAGIKMIANGSYDVANNSAVTEMGSFNTQESSFSATGLTFVYDWTTSQGNGEIACISLTSDVGGYIGYGNSVSHQSLSTKKSLIENQSANIFLNPYSSPVAYCIVGDTLYYAKTTAESDTELVFYSRSIGIDSEVSLFDFPVEHRVALPNAVKGTGYRRVISADGGFAVVKLSDQTRWEYSQGAKPISIYDILNDSWADHTARPPYSEQVAQIYTSSVHDGVICIGGHYDPGSTVTKLDTHEEFASVSSTSAVFAKITDDLYMRGTNSDVLKIKDAVNDTEYPTNGLVDVHFGSQTEPAGTMELSNGRFITYTSSQLRLFRNPLYLATVNNLEDVVTKTSDMSMKVTYTITPA